MANVLFTFIEQMLKLPIDKKNKHPYKNSKAFDWLYRVINIIMIEVNTIRHTDSALYWSHYILKIYFVKATSSILT